MTDPTIKRIPTLDGWRAVAIMLVMGNHSIAMLRNAGSAASLTMANILSHAGIGVDVFFSISGFLICTLLLREKEAKGHIALGSFYIRRFFRINPPILVYLSTLVLLTSIGKIVVSPFDITASLFFFRNYLSDGSWYTGHFWSLAIEEHFYLFVPLLLSILTWKASLRVTISATVACALIRFSECLWLEAAKVEFRTEARLDAIMYGAIGALIVFKHYSLVKRWLTPSVVISSVLLVLVGCLLFADMPIRRTLIAAVTPLPLIYTVLNPDGAVALMLDFASLRWVGKMSYSLYIWQMLFLVPAHRDMPVLQSFPFAWFFLIGAAIASYYYIERPAIKIGHRLADKFESRHSRQLSISSDHGRSISD